MNYRQTRNYENAQRYIFQDAAGAYDIPILKPTHVEPTEFIGFNFAAGCKSPETKGLHFFVDDYQFMRVWTTPDAYLGMLRRFKAVCSPDFSGYLDFPKALQILAHFRKHWLGAFWQMHGIEVIPTIGWSDESSFDWCFDGEPVGSTVAISSVGTQNDPETKELFKAGYIEMLRRLKPSTIIFQGIIPNDIPTDTCKIVHFDPFTKSMEKRINETRKAVEFDIHKTMRIDCATNESGV